MFIGYDTNALHLYSSGDVIPCGKDTLAVNKKPFDQKRIAKFSKDVLKGKAFGFAQVDIEVSDKLYDKFSEMSPLSVAQEIPDRDIPEEMKIYKNSFYAKMIEDKGRHKGIRFTFEERVVDKALRSPFFDNLEEIGGAYEILEFRGTVIIKRPYQCGIAVYQLAKLRMLEFYYYFLDQYFIRQDFKLCYMDTGSFYLAMSADSLDEIVKPGVKQADEADKKNLAREHPAYLSLNL